MKIKKKCSAFWVVFLLILATISMLAQTEDCACISASAKDVPLGGNILEIDLAGTVKQIKGKAKITTNVNGSGDIVVEIFSISKAEEKNLENDAWKIVENKKRKTACVTGEDGKFCFKNLKNGTYVLKIGTRTRDVEYFNKRYVIVKLNDKNGEDKEIDVELSLAN